MPSLLSNISSKADDCQHNSPVTDQHRVLELLRSREDNGRRKGQKLENVLQRHLGRGESGTGVFIDALWQLACRVGKEKKENAYLLHQKLNRKIKAPKANPAP